jgi:RNA polymerase sigma factor (sigma-70 family)
MPFDQFTSLSDNALLVAYANGTQEAARVLTERLTAKVFAQAYHMLRNRADAEDVTQEAFVRLWRIAPEWKQDQAQVTTWLYRVVANLCTDRLRKMRMAALDEAQEPADPNPSAGRRLQEQTRVDALYRALDDLPDRQRQAVSMRHLDGLANPEIASEMQLSVEAVESLIARGKQKLKALLKNRKSALGYQDDTI